MSIQYTSNWKRGESLPFKSSYVGNNMKSLYISVEKSLKNLRTNYIDILYVHWVSLRCYGRDLKLHDSLLTVGLDLWR